MVLESLYFLDIPCYWSLLEDMVLVLYVSDMFHATEVCKWKWCLIHVWYGLVLFFSQTKTMLTPSLLHKESVQIVLYGPAEKGQSVPSPGLSKLTW